MGRYWGVARWWVSSHTDMVSILIRLGLGNQTYRLLRVGESPGHIVRPVLG
jgi:hypothetical protein